MCSTWRVRCHRCTVHVQQVEHSVYAAPTSDETLQKHIARGQVRTCLWPAEAFRSSSSTCIGSVALAVYAPAEPTKQYCLTCSRDCHFSGQL